MGGGAQTKLGGVGFWEEILHHERQKRENDQGSKRIGKETCPNDRQLHGSANNAEGQVEA